MNLTERIKELSEFGIQFHIEEINLKEYALQGEVIARYDNGIEVIGDEEFSNVLSSDEPEYLILKTELGKDKVEKLFSEKSRTYFDIMLEGHKILDRDLNLIYYFTLPSRSYLKK